MPSITPNLWFDTEAEEAAAYYTSVFPNSRIVNVSRYTGAGPRPEGEVMTVDFELDGRRFTGINGGPEFRFSEAVSFLISCETQEDVDHYWERLTDGGEEGPCGWCKDRYERAQRAMEAMFKMRKLDIAALRAAADGVTA